MGKQEMIAKAVENFKRLGDLQQQFVLGFMAAYALLKQ